MVITYMHIGLIILTLIPTAIGLWIAQKGRFKAINIISTISLLSCTYLLIVPTGIDKFGFNSAVEFLLWLSAIILLSTAVPIIFFVNLKKHSAVFEFVMCLLLGIGLIITGIVEQHYILNIVAAVFTFLSIAKFTAVSSTDKNK